MEGVFRFKSWFLNAPGLIHGGAYYRNFTVVGMFTIYCAPGGNVLITFLVKNKNYRNIP